jgi:hypothetical protein
MIGAVIPQLRQQEVAFGKVPKWESSVVVRRHLKNLPWPEVDVKRRRLIRRGNIARE